MSPYLGIPSGIRFLIEHVVSFMTETTGYIVGNIYDTLLCHHELHGDNEEDIMKRGK